jgi:hypothetical protein
MTALGPSAGPHLITDPDYEQRHHQDDWPTHRVAFNSARRQVEVFRNYGTVKTESGSGFIKNAQRLSTLVRSKSRRLTTIPLWNFRHIRPFPTAGFVIVGDNCTS